MLKLLKLGKETTVSQKISCVELEIIQLQSMSEQITKPKKQHTHIELLRRYQKALEVKHLCKLVDVGVMFVPSKNEMPDAGHYPHFGRKQYCECTSQTMGYSNDPEFCCYHILASRMFWEQYTSKETRDELNLYDEIPRL